MKDLSELVVFPGAKIFGARGQWILKPIYHDYVMIRRYLIEYGFLDRHRDGSAYWVKT